MNTVTRISMIATLAICLFAFHRSASAQAAPSATSKAANPNPELVDQLTKQTGVTQQQAVGGAGAIFGLAKSKMNPADFSKVASAVPGMDKFLQAAPAAGGAGAPAAAGSATSALGSVTSALGGQTGGLASLAGSFHSLGMSPAQATKFVPVIQNYIGAKGGSGVASLFAGALK